MAMLIVRVLVEYTIASVCGVCVCVCVCMDEVAFGWHLTHFDC